jgi:hypothetical protein
MSDKVHQLHAVAPPSLPEKTKAGVIALLERALEEARAGDISEALIILQHANPELWSDRSSHLSNLSTWIGRLELSKFDLIKKHEEQDDE